MEKFYMVFLEGGHTPTYKHHDIDDAEKEAKRLVDMTGKKAYILGTIKSIELTKFKVSDCRVLDLPF